MMEIKVKDDIYKALDNPETKGISADLCFDVLDEIARAIATAIASGENYKKKINKKDELVYKIDLTVKTKNEKTKEVKYIKIYKIKITMEVAMLYIKHESEIKESE